MWRSLSRPHNRRARPRFVARRSCRGGCFSIAWQITRQNDLLLARQYVLASHRSGGRLRQLAVGFPTLFASIAAVAAGVMVIAEPVPDGNTIASPINCFANSPTHQHGGDERHSVRSARERSVSPSLVRCRNRQPGVRHCPAADWLSFRSPDEAIEGVYRRTGWWNMDFSR